MKNFVKLALPFMLATSLGTAPAVMAQGMESAPAQTPGTGMAPGTEMPGMQGMGTPDSPAPGAAQQPPASAPPSQGGGVSGPVDLGAAMSQIPQEKEKIEQVQQVAAVQVINVTGALQGGNEEVLDQLISSNKSQISELHSTIEKKPEMAQALQSQNVQVASVFAAQLNPDNSVTLFTR
ncbi:hypothetical protein [Limoniibacter endophyticus]|uniref:Uncharacterized protein n=1 Tax=Limoniibacter endophyticus TaxID=1565040 RepID=A0A8J3DK43_9HYPH|nr:hypothetical protein [Limoniibacter endophyticus]GHC75524.1 hypothetical protein GCM10010136_25560 [Limoniibacter endophyticus]